MKMILLSVLFSLGFQTHVAFAQTYTFEWMGAGGYSMHGAVLFDNVKKVPGILNETHVQCFEVHGYQDGEKIGDWYLQDRTPATTWRLHFDRARSAFLVIGDGVAQPQAWNMDGGGRNCGVDGFGFNLGSYAQDLCLNNTLITSSQVPPPTPLPAIEVQFYEFKDPSCQGEMILSQAITD